MICDPRCDLSWRMFHVHLRRWIILHLDGMSWRYQWDSSHLMYHLRHVYLLIFCFDDLSIGMRGVLKSPTISVLLSISPLMSVSVCHVLSCSYAGYMKWSQVAHLCPTLCDPMDCSLPGSIHGIFQARILEWVAITFSRGSSRPRDRTWVSRIAGRCFIWLPLGLIPWSLCSVLPYLL